MDNLSSFFHAKRPTYISVVCTLAFITMAWCLWTGIGKVLTSSNVNERVIDKKLEQLNDWEGMDVLPGNNRGPSRLAMKGRELGILIIATSLISLLGVTLLWQLKKRGFLIYLGAQLIFIIGALILARFDFNSLLQLPMSCIIAVLFIVVFAMKIKYLHNQLKTNQ